MRKKINNFAEGYSPWNYVGNMAGMAATGMTIGGPIGAGVGAVVGLAQSIGQQNASDKNDARQKMINSMSEKADFASQIRANHDMNNKENLGIPGFKKGKAGTHQPMIANVSKGEVIRDPIEWRFNSSPWRV